MWQATIRNNIQARLSAKQRKKQIFPFCSSTRHKQRSDIIPQNRAGHRSNATCSRYYSTCIMYRIRFMVTSWWVMDWAVQLVSSIASLYLQDCLHQFYPWLGTSLLGAAIRVFIPNVASNWYFCVYFVYLGQNRLPQNVWTWTYPTVPEGHRFHFQICNGWQGTTWNLLPLLKMTSHE